MAKEWFDIRVSDWDEDEHGWWIRVRAFIGDSVFDAGTFSSTDPKEMTEQELESTMRYMLLMLLSKMETK